jgi:hypothetical protein
MEDLVVVEIFRKLLPLVILISGCVYNPPLIATSEKSFITKKEESNSNPLPKIKQKPRPDPFESLVKPQADIIPARSLALDRRLASYPKHSEVAQESDVPLPNLQRRVAGIIKNGGISAILETVWNGEVFHTLVTPGAKVPSGIPGKLLTVQAITSEYLILISDDNRSVKVSLSGASPEMMNSLKRKF